MKTFWNLAGLTAFTVWTLVSVSMLTGLPIGQLIICILGAIGLLCCAVALWPPRVDGTRTASSAPPSTPEDLDPNHTISKGKLR